MKDKEVLKNKMQNPGWVAYLSPFTYIVPDDEEPLKISLDEINANSYEHGKLCSIVSRLKIHGFDYDIKVCYDGAFTVPRINRFTQIEESVDFFNELFCKLLLGGIFCEAIDRRDVVHGQLHEKKLVWPVDFGNSASSHLHSKIRLRVASNVDTIILLNAKHIYVSDLKDALLAGEKILKTIPNLTPKFLIRGVTEIKYRNWDLVLSNLWITVEQLIDFIWNNIYIKDEKYHPKSSLGGRIKSLKNDNRTWSATVKQEILFQNGIINEIALTKLFPARVARNNLVHDGQTVSKDIAYDLFQAVRLLLGIATSNENIPLQNIEEDSWESRSDETNFNATNFINWKIF